MVTLLLLIRTQGNRCFAQGEFTVVYVTENFSRVRVPMILSRTLNDPHWGRFRSPSEIIRSELYIKRAFLYHRNSSVPTSVQQS